MKHFKIFFITLFTLLLNACLNEQKFTSEEPLNTSNTWGFEEAIKIASSVGKILMMAGLLKPIGGRYKWKSYAI